MWHFSLRCSLMCFQRQTFDICNMLNAKGTVIFFPKCVRCLKKYRPVLSYVMALGQMFSVLSAHLSFCTLTILTHTDTSIPRMCAVRINLMFMVDITWLLYIQTSLPSKSNSSLCCTLPMETQGLYWLIKAHNLNCGLCLPSSGAGANMDNDTQLSAHIL